MKRVVPVVTQGNLPVYVSNQFKGPPMEDANFRTPLPLTASEDDVETSQTVTQRATLGKTAFQVGSRLLHGCTIVTVVSNRVVYMVRTSPPVGVSDSYRLR